MNDASHSPAIPGGLIIIRHKTKLHTQLGRVPILLPRTRLDQHAQKALDGAVPGADQGQLAVDQGEVGQGRRNRGAEEPAVDVVHRRIENPGEPRDTADHVEHQGERARAERHRRRLVGAVKALDVGLVILRALFVVFVRWDHGYLRNQSNG